MTTENIRYYLPGRGVGGSVPIPGIEGLHEISGIEFKVINMRWISPTDDYNLQTLIEQALKGIIEDFTYKDSPLVEEVVTRGVTPRKDSTAMIMMIEPFNDFQKSNQGKHLVTTASGRVGFIFRKDALEAVARRKLAPQMLSDYMLKNAICKVEIP